MIGGEYFEIRNSLFLACLPAKAGSIFLILPNFLQDPGLLFSYCRGYRFNSNLGIEDAAGYLYPEEILFAEFYFELNFSLLFFIYRYPDLSFLGHSKACNSILF